MDKVTLPKAVSFDLDGTLYSLKRAGFRMLFTMTGSLRFLAAYQRLRKELRQKTFESGEALHLAEHSALAEAFETDLSEARERLERVHDQELVRTIGAVGPYRAARPVLEGLKGRGVPIAILSDLPVDRKLEALGLSDIDFAAALDSTDTGALKPHRRPFERVAEALGVPLSELTHVGDRHDTDVVGAERCGARAVWVCRRPKRAVSPGTLIVPSLRALGARWGLL